MMCTSEGNFVQVAPKNRNWEDQTVKHPWAPRQRHAEVRCPPLYLCLRTLSRRRTLRVTFQSSGRRVVRLPVGFRGRLVVRRWQKTDLSRATELLWCLFCAVVYFG